MIRRSRCFCPLEFLGQLLDSFYDFFFYNKIYNKNLTA